ncbi:hypothetical protein DL771_001143 [Monosporascus sp. 5C6A]|nr:hypothetical protein DL771_001143 [Monosporascus sp. 5C6A]
MEASGFERLQDFDAGKLIGYGTVKATIDTRTATRSTAESSFLQMAVRGSDTIKLYPNALATRITFDATKKATGVDVMSNVATSTELKYHLSVNKEVIVTAGVWRSPQLLMVSGVGPADTLQQHGIDVVADLPAVGQDEWDQPARPMMSQVGVKTHTQLNAGSPEVVAEQLDLYLNHQSGMLSGLAGGQATAFDKFSVSNRANFSDSTKEWLDSFPSDWPRRAIQPGMHTPKSKGNMTISSASILDSPVISPNWYEDEADVEMAYAAFQRLREIGSNWDSSVNLGEVFPGPDVSSKDNIIEWLRNNSFQMSHGSSTTKMGTDDKTSVVDSQGRVHGVTGLRVGDAAAFPFCPPDFPCRPPFAESILEGN